MEKGAKPPPPTLPILSVPGFPADPPSRCCGCLAETLGRNSW